MTQTSGHGARSEAVDPRGQAQNHAMLSAAPSASAERSEAAPEAPSSGLVCIRTSDTLILNTRISRIRRLRRSLFTATRLIDESYQESGIRHRKAFVTVTYAKPDVWSPLHITTLIKCYREWSKRRGFKLRYAWAAEIQPHRFFKTGQSVVHYHLVLWIPRGLTPPLPDKQGWWRHGASNAKWVRNPVAYMAKYLSKEGVGKFPEGCRLYGVGGLSAVDRVRKAWYMAPSWLREFTTEGSMVVRVAGGWWDKTGGWWYRSPWIITGFRVDGPELRWVGWGLGDVELWGNSMPAHAG